MHTLGSLFMAVVVGLAWTAPQPAPTAPYTSGACLSCHEIASVLSHPLGRAASTSGLLPLELGGRMGCATCHDARALSADHGASGAKDGLLLLPAAQLCASCHGRESGSGSALAHGLGMGRAHLAPPGKGLGGQAFARESGLDSESRSCLGCHDGSVAGAASVASDSTIQAIGLQRSSVEAEHPVGVRYDGLDALALGAASTLRPESGLPPEIRLANGRVGCGSCHSAYSGTPGMLVRSTRRGDLCLSCHIK